MCLVFSVCVLVEVSELDLLSNISFIVFEIFLGPCFALGVWFYNQKFRLFKGPCFALGVRFYNQTQTEKQNKMIKGPCLFNIVLPNETGPN